MVQAIMQAVVLAIGHGATVRFSVFEFPMEVAVLEVVVMSCMVVAGDAMATVMASVG